MSDIIYNWLKGYPGLELLQRQQVDAVPGGCGLFYRGATDSGRNLLGQTKKTFHFRLNRYGQPEESAVFFLLLEAWVEANTQNLGSVQTAACKNARCVHDEGGLALWEADLEVQEF